MIEDLHFQFHDSITALSQPCWNRLAQSHGPFLRYEFFAALETEGCTNAETGWTPHHLSVYAGAAENGGRLIAVVPLFLKTNSYGEYVFDWSWADAYYRNGLQYYPKFVTAVPFTPSYDSRVLIDETQQMPTLVENIVKVIIKEARRLGASSWHILFPTSQQSVELTNCGIHQRQGTQFHWFNRDYQDFDHFLESFSSRKRKNIRKERQKVSAENISFECFEGGDITPLMWQIFYDFYKNTYRVRGQNGYLTQSFFVTLGAKMPENMVMVVAIKDGEKIAAALSFKDKDKLFGRYWGCLEEYQFLHFETCYYQGIDYAIKNSLKSFDSGAQGEHKIQRGFEPIATFSNHWISDERFEAAIVDFLKEEKIQVQQYREAARSMLPFRQSDEN